MITLTIPEDLRAQAAALVQAGGTLQAQVVQAQQTTALNPQLTSLLQAVLEHAAEGRRVQLQAMPEELSPAAAADFLGVSRPTVMKWIRQGEIPARKVGSHHRIETHQLEYFRAKLERQREESFHRLREIEDESGISWGQ